MSAGAKTTNALDDYAAFKIYQRKCSICTHPLRDEIDMMLVGEERNDDDQTYTMDEIVAWVVRQDGPDITRGSLSRHHRNHVQPSWRQMLQMQRQMEALSEATGKQLTLPSVFTNVLISKGVRYLDSLDEAGLGELDPHKLLNIMNAAARNAMHLRKAEALLSKQVVEKVDQQLSEKLRDRGIDPDVLATIKAELYGLTPAEEPS